MEEKYFRIKLQCEFCKFGCTRKRVKAHKEKEPDKKIFPLCRLCICREKLKQNMLITEKLSIHMKIIYVINAI